MPESLQATLYGVFLIGFAIVVFVMRRVIFRTGDKFSHAIVNEQNKTQYLRRKRRNYNIFIYAILALGLVFIIGGLLS